MGLALDVNVLDRLKEMGRVDDNTVCVINHFSHNGIAGYDEDILYIVECFKQVKEEMKL